MVTTTATAARTRPRSNNVFMERPEAFPDPSPFRRDTNIPHMFTGPDQYWADPEHAHTIACQLESLLYTGAVEK